MTNELEKQFFDTFGIEPKKEYYCPSCDTKLEEWKTEKGLYYMCGNCCECDYVLDSLDEEFEEILKNLSYRTEYPQITDRILLELIKLLIIDEGVNISGFNIVDLDGRQYKEFGITCLDYFYDEPECDEEDYEPIQSTGTLKECVLKALILINEKYNDFLKHQVRTLFEEG